MNVGIVVAMVAGRVLTSMRPNHYARDALRALVLSRMFTAVTVVKLIERKQLSFDALSVRSSHTIC